MKFLKIIAFLALSAGFLLSRGQAQEVEPAIYSDGIVTVYTSPTDINAVILYSAIYKSVYVPGQGFNAGVRVVKDWDGVKPWDKSYFYWINDRTVKIQERKFF